MSPLLSCQGFGHCLCPQGPLGLLSLVGLVFHSDILSIVWVLFYLGLDFFQLISLVDLIHFLSTMSMKSHPVSCPSRRTCKYGWQNLLCGQPGQSGPHSERLPSLGASPGTCLSVLPSIRPSIHPHFSNICFMPGSGEVLGLQRPRTQSQKLRAQQRWGLWKGVGSRSRL